MVIKYLEGFGLLFYCLLIFWLSSQASLPAPMWFEHQDKLYHAGCYFILGLLLWRYLGHWQQVPIIRALLAVFLGSLYGVSDEWHQSFVPGRSSSVADWLADSIGVAMAVFCLLKLRNGQKI